jgi:DNA polymerase-3 subunit delta'
MPFTSHEALELLRRAHAQDRLAHAYLLTGPAGAGKRALARNLSALLHGPNDDPLADSDVHTVEPESKSRRIVIEQIRELERELHMRSFFGGRKIGIVFDAERLQAQAANAFLKTLEEPPNNSLLLLLSSLPEQLPETIVSRCIEVPLKSSVTREWTPLQNRLVTALQEYAALEKPALPEIFRLVRTFTDLLAEARETVRLETDAALKTDEQHYKQTSDARAWLEDREDYYKALTEARYQQSRLDLLAIVDAWWGDVLRQQHGGTTLDLAEAVSQTAGVAARFSPANVLRRADALEKLREHLANPGVQEQLAIECAFLKAFAP